MNEEPLYKKIINKQRIIRKLRFAITPVVKQYGLTVTQWLMISLLRDSPPQKISELAKTLDTSMAHVTSNINLLVARKLVSKNADPKDNRLRYITYIPNDEVDLEDIEIELANRLPREGEI